MQIYGNIEWFVHNIALFGLVIEWPLYRGLIPKLFSFREQNLLGPTFWVDPAQKPWITLVISWRDRNRLHFRALPSLVLAVVVFLLRVSGTTLILILRRWARAIAKWPTRWFGWMRRRRHQRVLTSWLLWPRFKKKSLQALARREIACGGKWNNFDWQNVDAKPWCQKKEAEIKGYVWVLNPK